MASASQVKWTKAIAWLVLGVLLLLGCWWYFKGTPAKAQGGVIEPLGRVEAVDSRPPQFFHEVYTAVVVTRGSVDALDGTIDKGGWLAAGGFVAGPDGATLVGVDGLFMLIQPGDIIDIDAGDGDFPYAESTNIEGTVTVTTSCSLESCGRGERFCGWCDGFVSHCTCKNGTQDQTKCTTLAGTDGAGGSVSCSGSTGTGATVAPDGPASLDNP